VADLTRRAFIGRTLLTGATIASGGLATISTSPTPSKVAISQKGIRWTNLNVLSPKAKAYRRFLKGIRTLDFVASRVPLGDGSNKGISTGRNIRSLITKSSSEMKVVDVNKGGKNLARRAFSAAISPGDRVGGRYLKGTSSVFTSEIMRTIAPQRAALLTPKQAERVWKTQRILGENIHQQGGKVYRKEVRKQRRVDKGIKPSAKQKRVRAKGEIIPTVKRGAKVGGGGKMALPGLESAKNPTGLSLVTQRYTL